MTYLIFLYSKDLISRTVRVVATRLPSKRSIASAMFNGCATTQFTQSGAVMGVGRVDRDHEENPKAVEGDLQRSQKTFLDQIVAHHHPFDRRDCTKKGYMNL